MEKKLKIEMFDYRGHLVADAKVLPEEAKDVADQFSPYFFKTKIVSHVERRESSTRGNNRLDEND